MAKATKATKEERYTVSVCRGTECVFRGSRALAERFRRETAKHKLADLVEIAEADCGCRSLCHAGPIVTVQPGNVVYGGVKPKDVPRIVADHLEKGRPVADLRHEAEAAALPSLMDLEFFRHQCLVALRNRGRLDAESIEDYIGNDGYLALAKALTKMKPEEVIAEVETSGLGGRGGAGFPTARKWALCRRAASTNGKYLVCNADEGDPGAFMDRSLLEADPHTVLEGMIIGAYAIGANYGFVYVRDEYPLAVRRITLAIEQAHEYGLLGKNILGSGFDFDVEVVRGGGAFVCGEETALMASIEGRDGRPRPRPPYPAEKGIWGSPTNINNVETWANVPPIIARGGEWFAGIGTEHSKGTKVFSLVGKVENTGLIEVPMGMTLRRIIYDIGGGIPQGKQFKAVQTGGPSGGCIPAHLIDLPVDYKELTQAGAIMGSGGLIVMDEDTCMVDVARYFVSFLEEESCGKCTPCREGLKRMKEILTDICEGEGKEGDIETLENLAGVIKDSALCGLGNTAPNPVLTTLRYFRDEYEAHILRRECPARVCKALIIYRVIPEKCTGCQRCVRECPVDAITGPRSQPHTVDESKCIKCGACYEICRFDAIAGDAIYVE